MNWFDTSGLTSLAKTALKEAQKTIDKALDIQDESGEEDQAEESPEKPSDKPSSSNIASPKDNSDFFSSWGLTVSAESPKKAPVKDQPVVTESPSKSGSQSMWGSFAGSFFEQPKTGDPVSTIVRPPKAKSMNVISDSKYGSNDDLFSKTQLVMSDSGAEASELKKDKVYKDIIAKDERRSSNQSNRLSLVSSRNSSDSVEVLSQSVKTTPDSEAASVHSISHSSSVGQKLNSESVEVLPDSLVSPSSIECLGFDSYSSDKNSCSSSNLSPCDLSDKKSTPVGGKESAETADSVSLVADEDEDTMSYNSISECTAPTVLDTDDKPISPYPKVVRTEPQRKIDKELMHLDQPLLPQRMLMSENSSNDGSWSDRTLNADSDSINLEGTLEDQKKEVEHEDNVLMEKLSDSSSFYNVNVTGEVLPSESSAFINVEKQQCTDSSESSQKDTSVKERNSPISSDSKSDLVKIGSDRTSGHTSGDEIETATSSDIEIIPSPNGDNGHSFCRSSPAKYSFKHGATSPNLVDLVLGKSLATKIRGHNRELSEASIQSNISDESQGSENDRLMKRLCEMAEVLEARENRLLEVSRSNAELAESNSSLKTQVESLLAKHEVGDINTITEDYTQRMSALEKKFQQAIREKDQLRKQLDSLKSESSSRKNSSEMENTLKEKDDVIAQLQEEGEKLARQQLQHSNIIKKLRAKEKDNEQVIKSLRDKVSELTAELDRLKRQVAAKEEVEVNQMETVYRLTQANKKYETEIMETRSALDDATQRSEGALGSLEAARRELAELRRAHAELARRAEQLDELRAERDRAAAAADELRAALRQHRADHTREEQRWVGREEALRRELSEARELCAALEAGAGAPGAPGAGAGAPGAAGAGEGAAALLAQLAALQRAALDRDRLHAAGSAALLHARAEAEAAAAKASERERLAREELEALHERLAAAEGLLGDAQGRLRGLADQCRLLGAAKDDLEHQLTGKTLELERVKADYETQMSELQRRAGEAERRLAAEGAALDAERRRAAILQEQLAARGDLSPPHSVASDSLSNSLWTNEEVGRMSPGGYSPLGAAGTGGAGGAAAARRGAARAAGLRRAAGGGAPRAAGARGRAAGAPRRPAESAGAVRRPAADVRRKGGAAGGGAPRPAGRHAAVQGAARRARRAAAAARAAVAAGETPPALWGKRAHNCRGSAVGTSYK